MNLIQSFGYCYIKKKKSNNKICVVDDEKLQKCPWSLYWCQIGELQVVPYYTCTAWGELMDI